MMFKKLIFCMFIIPSLTSPSYGMKGDEQIDVLLQLSSQDDTLAKALDIIVHQDDIHHFNRLYAAKIYAEKGGSGQEVINCVQSIVESDIDPRNKEWAQKILTKLQENLGSQ